MYCHAGKQLAENPRRSYCEVTVLKYLGNVVQLLRHRIYIESSHLFGSWHGGVSGLDRVEKVCEGVRVVEDFWRLSLSLYTGH